MSKSDVTIDEILSLTRSIPPINDDKKLAKLVMHPNTCDVLNSGFKPDGAAADLTMRPNTHEIIKDEIVEPGEVIGLSENNSFIFRIKLYKQE